MPSVPDAQNTLAGIAVEGAADFFFGRPFDENPYSRETARDGWDSWRFGWLEAASFEEMRGREERSRWRLEDAA
jgi:hypothetical protein